MCKIILEELSIRCYQNFKQLWYELKSPIYGDPLIGVTADWTLLKFCIHLRLKRFVEGWCVAVSTVALLAKAPVNISRLCCANMVIILNYWSDQLQIILLYFNDKLINSLWTKKSI